MPRESYEIDSEIYTPITDKNVAINDHENFLPRFFQTPHNEV